MNVLWTTKALNRLQRLQQVHDYLGKEQPVTLLFVERLARLAEAIGKDPEAGHLMPYFDDAEVREVIDGTYKVAYRVLPGQIHILTVRHTARR